MGGTGVPRLSELNHRPGSALLPCATSSSRCWHAEGVAVRCGGRVVCGGRASRGLLRSGGDRELVGPDRSRIPFSVVVGVVHGAIGCAGDDRVPGLSDEVDARVLGGPGGPPVDVVGGVVVGVQLTSAAACPADQLLVIDPGSMVLLLISCTLVSRPVPPHRPAYTALRDPLPLSTYAARPSCGA